MALIQFIDILENIFYTSVLLEVVAWGIILVISFHVSSFLYELTFYVSGVLLGNFLIP